LAIASTPVSAYNRRRTPAAREEAEREDAQRTVAVLDLDAIFCGLGNRRVTHRGPEQPVMIMM